MREVSFDIESVDGSYQARMESVYEVESLAVTDQSYGGGPAVAQRWPYLKGIEVPGVVGKLISVLIGMDLATAHLQKDHRIPPIGVKGPVAIKTAFGWSLVGPTPEMTSEKRRRSRKGRTNVTLTAEDEALSESLTRFWDWDSACVRLKPPVLPESEAKGLEILQRTTRNIGEQYEVGVMWAGDKRPTLASGEYEARKQFGALERKFNKKPDFASAYAAVVNGYIADGYARKVSARELKKQLPWTRYLPHHGVVTTHKPGKVRVVFNAAAKVNGVSLNDCLIQGPNFLTSQLGVFLRFRRGAVALSADIKAMFHQVKLPVDDQAAFCFLWRNPNDIGAKVETYMMTAHIFGAVSSPSSCMYALNRVTEDYAEEYSEVAPCVKKHFYVDNYIEAVDSVEVACRRVEKLTELLHRGHFHLTKWASSSRDVLKNVPVEDRSEPTLNLDLDQLPVERTLGVRWNADEDARL